MDTRISLSLQGLKVSTVPLINISIDGVLYQTVKVDGVCQIVLETELNNGDHRLEIDFRNKNYRDISSEHDMAVIIEKVTFQSVVHDFKIYSRYRPEYPLPWAQQQTDLKEEIHGNYLGWNGKWILDFQTPIYPWIHRRLDLGWLL